MAPFTGYTQYQHAEFDDSPQEEASTEKGGGFNATVHLMVPWSQRTLVAGDIVGQAQLYPRIPDSGARAVSCSIKPFKAAVNEVANQPGMATYAYADMTIHYKLQAETADFISESLEPSAEFLTMNTQDCAWGAEFLKYKDYLEPSDQYPQPKVGDDKLILPLKDSTGTRTTLTIQTFKQDETGSSSAQVGRIQRTLDYIITFYRVMGLPDNLGDYVDCVNDKEVNARLLNQKFERGTLLFNPPQMKRKWNYTTFPFWELTYKLTWKKMGWNWYWSTKLEQDGMDPARPDEYVWDMKTKKYVSTEQGGYDCVYVRGPVTDGGRYQTWYMWDNFPYKDFTPAFTLDMNLSPYQS